MATRLAFGLMAGLISLCAHAAQPVSPVPNDRFVLTISGGVSLGAYDAGRNWVLLRDLHYRRKQPGGASEEALAAVTGASAGAINAFVSALDWCTESGVPDGNTLSQNPYRTLWTTITFEKLLPTTAEQPWKVDADNYTDEHGRFIHHDGLLARANADKAIIELLRAWYESDGTKFRPRCRIPMGVAVTRAEPGAEELFEGVGFTFPRQTFYIPIVLEIGADGRPHLYYDDVEAAARRIDFSTDAYEAVHHFDGPTLRLPSCSDGDGSLCHATGGPHPDREIAFEQMVSALYASAAFPVAFGRVFLDYCAPSVDGRQSLGCPAGQEVRTSDFVDGGVLDNVPVGFALALGNTAANDEKQLRFYYVDPDILEPGVRPAAEAEARSAHPSYGLAAQLSFFGGTVQTVRAAGRVRPILDLCRETESPTCNDRAIIAKRSAPITGEMLGAFAAFLDPRFSEYDYLLGVADGLYTVTAMDVENPTLDDVKRHARMIGVDDGSDSWATVEWLLNRNGQVPAPEADFGVIRAALQSANTHAGPDFSRFAAALRDADFDTSDNRLLTNAIDEPQRWYLGILRLSANRLRTLQFQSEADRGSVIGALFGMADNYMQLTAPRRGWETFTTIDRRLWWLPPQIGWEVIDGSLEAAWRPTWFGENIDLEFPTGFAIDAGERVTSRAQAQLGVNLRFKNFKVPFGIGPRAYLELDGADERYYGGAIFADPLSAVRLELSYRDAPTGDQLNLSISSYDFPSIWRIFR